MNREKKRNKQTEKAIRETVRPFKKFIAEVWESNESMEFFFYNIKGKRLNIIEEIPMCIARLPDNIADVMLKELFSNEEIVDALLESFESGEILWEPKNKLKDFGFTDFMGMAYAYPAVDIARVVMQAHIEGCVIVFAYAMLAFAEHAIKPERERNLELTNIFVDSMGYWLKEKGLIDNQKKDAVVIRRRYPYLVQCMQERIVEDRYVENIIEMHPKRGKIYADFKLGEIGLERFLELTAGYTEECGYLRLVDLEEFISNYVRDDEVEHIMADPIGKEAWAKAATTVMRDIRKLGLYWGYANVLDERCKKQKKQMEHYRENAVRELEEKNKALEKERDIKKTVKEKEARIKDLNGEIKILHKRIHKLQELTSNGVQDVKPFEEEIEKLKGIVEEKLERIQLKDREHGKIQTELDNLREKYERLKSVHEELTGTVESYELEKKELLEEGSDMEIPVDILIKPIKDKRITVIGGDSLHSVIRDLGFTDIRFVKTSAIINQKALDKCDLVVYMTREMGHRHYYQAESMIKSRDIKTLNFNNRSIPRLCKEIFIALNS